MELNDASPYEPRQLMTQASEFFCERLTAWLNAVANAHSRWCVIAMLVACTTALGAPVNYEVVRIGDPGNAADTTGCGSVAYSYNIGRYEVAIEDYCSFLNAIAKVDTYSLYHPNMERDLNIVGIARTGTSGAYSYTAIGSSRRPITYTSWFDAARFANWMANGQPYGPQDETTTEDGAYALHGLISGTAPSKNATNPNTCTTPRYSIPTENEWFKAAYYKGGGTDAGYWQQATQSDISPGNKIGSLPNQANLLTSVYSVTQSSQRQTNQNYLSDVGSFTSSASAYETFDQCGNVHEWTDLNGDPGLYRGLSGGGWYYIASGLNRFESMKAPSGVIVASYESNVGAVIGFRIASPVLTAIDVDVPSGSRTQAETGFAVLSGTLPLHKRGSGTLLLNGTNTFTGPTVVSQGVLVADSPAALRDSHVSVSGSATLKISGGISAAVAGLAVSDDACIDVTTGAILIAGGPSVPTVLAWLQAGYANGTWSSSRGLTSSTAAQEIISGTPRTVGWVDNRDSSLTVAYAAPGDTNLDWQLDILDVANVIGSGKYNSGVVATWADGDFNYDGRADMLDIADFTSSGLFNAGSYNSPAQSITSVPEPSAAVLFLAGLAGTVYFASRPRKQI